MTMMDNKLKELVFEDKILHIVIIIYAVIISVMLVLLQICVTPMIKLWGLNYNFALVCIVVGVLLISVLQPVKNIITPITQYNILFIYSLETPYISIVI